MEIQQAASSARCPFIRRPPFAIVFFVSAIALAFQAIGAGEAFTGMVVHVVDGDTITVRRGGEEVRVRLSSIDCPERRQAFGRQAQYATTAMAIGKLVTVVVDGKDRNGRILGEVLLPDGTSLNRTLVRTGWAWHFRQYSRDHHLAELEAEARRGQRGLWADPHPIPPWEYRKRRSTRSSRGRMRLMGMVEGDERSKIGAAWAAVSRTDPTR